MEHSHPQDAVKIVNGVYMGGFNAALGAVQSGRSAPRDFKWFSRYAGWSPGQLQRECDAGVWFPAAASASVVLNNGPTSMSGVWMWHQVLELMGGEYAKLSDAVKVRCCGAGSLCIMSCRFICIMSCRL